MENDYIAKLKEIQKNLKELGISSSLKSIRNFEDVLIIVSTYSPDDNSTPVSIAFSINNTNLSFNRKCWITQEKVREISPHPDYREFEYNTKKFYPFSVLISDVDKYPVSADCIKRLCKELYQYIDF